MKPTRLLPSAFPKLALCLAAAIVPAATANADVRTMTFDTDAWGNPIAPGTTLDMHYAAWGVGANANTYTGDDWATNTDMTMGTDVGINARSGFGNCLHNLTGWTLEDADPSFELTFLYRIDAISAVFTGVGINDNIAGMIVYNDLDQVIAEARVVDPALGGELTQTLSLTNLHAASRVVILPGTFDDWIGIDDITFTDAALPAPSAGALAGIACALAARRRRN